MVQVDRIRQNAKHYGLAAAILAVAALLAWPASAAPPTWSARFNAGSQDAPVDPVAFQQGGSQFGGFLGSQTVAVDAQGNTYVAGRVTVNPQNGLDFLVEKFDAAGNLVWVRTLDGGSQFDDFARCLALSSNAVYVTGMTCKESSCDAADFLTVKYDAASGAQVWAKLADGPDHLHDQGGCVAVDASGNPFVAGTVWNASPANWQDFMTIKYDPATGAETWRSIATTSPPAAIGFSSDFFGVIGVGADGNVVVSGGGDVDNLGTAGLLTVKYDGANGSPLWTHFATSISNVVPHAIVLDAVSNPIVVGETDKFGDPKFFTLKYQGATGGLWWMKNLNYAPAGGDDGAHDVALDVVGNVYVTGRVRIASGYLVFTVKYDWLFGNELWVHGLGTGLLDDDYLPTAIAYSGANDRVIVAGYHQSPSGTRDFLVESLNAANGTNAPLQVSSDVLPWDLGVDVATDSAGNVMLAGGAISDTDRDLMVLKYSPSLAELWRASEPALETHEALGSLSPPQFGRKKIAIDSLGNTVVVGSTALTASSTDSDFLIQKYGPGGNRLWSRTIAGPAGTDYATAVVLGGTSDVYVTGWSLGLGTDYDILTLRLNASTGATIWSQRYNNVANQSDVAYGIALGNNRVFVVGAFAAGGKYSPLVLGYPLADGNSPWTASLDFPGGGIAYAVALGCRDQIFNLCIEGVYLTGVAIDAIYPGSGNELLTALFDAGSGTFVSGLTQGGGTNATGYAIATTGSPATMVATGRSGGDWMTTAFQGNSGLPLWTHTRDFDAREDQSFDVAFDLSGNAFVTGFATQMPARNKQLATIKYAAASGTELAVSRSGPIDEDLTGYGVATDFAGNVYVAGSRFALASQKNDFLLFKYSNGLALVSGDFFDANGSDSADDWGTALAVERVSGDAVVGGTTFGASAAGDLLLAKYRAPEQGNFYTTTPCRLYDSRNDPSGPISGGQTRVISVLGFVGSCQLLTPKVKSLAINATAVSATSSGHLQLYPGNFATPNTSVLNFAAGQTRANNAVLNLATDAAGTFVIRSGLPAGQTVHVIVDVAGYFD